MSFSMGDKQIEICRFKVAPALARWLSWLEHCFIRRVPYIKRLWFDPWKGRVGRQPINVSHIHVCLSVCLSVSPLPPLPSYLPPSLSKNQGPDYLVRIFKIIVN